MFHYVLLQSEWLFSWQKCSTKFCPKVQHHFNEHIVSFDIYNYCYNDSGWHISCNAGFLVVNNLFAFFPLQAANVQKKLVNFQIPLFLRFLNLLINDSIFLLDEALQVPYDAYYIYLYLHFLLVEKHSRLNCVGMRVVMWGWGWGQEHKKEWKEGWGKSLV